jgi:hypothetical protein
VGQDLHHGLEGRLDDEINEADLSLGDISGVPVEHLADSKALFLLEVTLLEKFNK